MFTEVGSVLTAEFRQHTHTHTSRLFWTSSYDTFRTSQIFHRVFRLSSSSELGAGGPPVGTRPAEDEAGRHVAGPPGPDLRPGPGPALDSLHQRYEGRLSDPIFRKITHRDKAIPGFFPSDILIYSGSILKPRGEAEALKEPVSWQVLPFSPTIVNPKPPWSCEDLTNPEGWTTPGHQPFPCADI